jgi:hypothetical protein
MVKALQVQGIPSKLIRLIRRTLEGTQARVVTENSMTEIFNVNVGVRQSGALSVILWSLTLDYIIKKLDTRGNISAKWFRSMCMWLIWL